MRRLDLRQLLHSSAIALLLAVSGVSVTPVFAQEVSCEPPVTVEQAPPPLPVYAQPPVPAPGYIWTPGYWAWDDDQNDYYWTPGTWVEPPQPGLLWTPGYWGWIGGIYLFHRGYWGPQVGFYGGINYGYGYGGAGYEGGRWDHGTFYYNRTVNNISNRSITNVYDKTVIVNRSGTNVSYNGGHGGIVAHPTSEQKAYARQAHFAPTPDQLHHAAAARGDRALFVSENHGKPPVTPVSHPANEKIPHEGERPAAHPPIANAHGLPRHEPVGAAHPPKSEPVHAHPAARPVEHEMKPPPLARPHPQPHAAPHPHVAPPHPAPHRAPPRPAPHRPAPHPHNERHK
jgi:hypothetical protein